MTSERPDRRPWRDARADVEDELAYHLDRREEDACARGLTPEQAREAARRRFGDVERISTEVRSIDEQSAREQRRAGMWSDLRQDVLYATRELRRAPGFTAVAVMTVALGIGANTAIFSAIDATVLRPLPFPDASHLVFLWNTRAGSSEPEPIGPGRMMDFRSQATSFSGFAAISHLSFTLTGGADPERIDGSSVSSPFFDVLGARPLLGETFHAHAADPGAVVLSHRLWARRFNNDPAIIGKTIALNGRPRTVLAVMSADFVWPAITARPSPMDQGPEVWVPGGPGDVPRPATNEDEDVTRNRNAGYIRVVARLKPGARFEQARAEVGAIGARLSRTYKEDDGRGATLVSLRDQFTGSVERPLLVLAGAVAFVLAIACANVASLLLGRGVSRRRELALRRALGATRARIVRQLLTESIVLAVMGGVAGIALAWWASSSLLSLAPPDLAVSGARIDPRVLAFTLFVTMVVGVAFGAAPAIELSRGALTPALNEGAARSAGSRRSSRVRDVLVAGEIAVALVLLVGAALLVRSFVRLTRVDTGIATHNLLTFDVRLTGSRAEYQSRQVQFYTAALDRLRTVPGVMAAGAAVTLPIGGDDFGTGYLVEGKPLPQPGKTPQAGYQIVTPRYFAAMGIPVLAGRDFRPSDAHDSQPVALVNDALARQQWPGQDPIGRRVRFDDGGDWMTVVGVVGDIRHLGPAVPPRPELYQPVAQRSFPFMAFVVRTDRDPYTVLPSIRRAIADLDPNMPLAGVKTMDEHIAAALSRPRFLSTLVSAFGALALTLAVIGIYGMMAWSVGQRRQEIAVRMALGAGTSDVLRLVLGRALVLASAGIACGLVVARVATSALQGLLYGTSAAELSGYALTAAALGVAAVVAAYIPARRATVVDPVAALR
jgi:putative ABC transport system permease protein